MLYVEVPTFEHLNSLLHTKIFRGTAHFRTQDGYVPYYGGGIAFNARSLVSNGIEPLWYLRKGGLYDRALYQLVEDGIYEDELTAEHHCGGGYPRECEWAGPAGFRFEASWIVFAWYNPRRAPLEDVLNLKADFPELDLRDAPTQA
jgi:hypothetical protein